jgi:hypothetical protein
MLPLLFFSPLVFNVYMDWNIISQSLIAAVISSAVVSSMVTSYLKERSDLKKKKLEIYTNYLQRFYKIFPALTYGFGLQSNVGKTVQEFQNWKAIHEPEIRELERYLLHVVLIGDPRVVSHATAIQAYLHFVLRDIGDRQFKSAIEYIMKAEKTGNQLVNAMTNEVRGRRIYTVKRLQFKTVKKT